ncbi:tectonin beta-propeller repeat-containing protein isoform X3 [Bacillus rossius redtenbacheri]|uniref:tectonin beta-propeller repeat-containing protein isoform X3 n=1 Tax=Bacillus rossius redtenbacheri TaxID=93214 RepID=UPI002FDD4F1A
MKSISRRRVVSSQCQGELSCRERLAVPAGDGAHQREHHGAGGAALDGRVGAAGLRGDPGGRGPHGARVGRAVERPRPRALRRHPRQPHRGLLAGGGSAGGPEAGASVGGHQHRVGGDPGPPRVVPQGRPRGELGDQRRDGAGLGLGRDGRQHGGRLRRGQRPGVGGGQRGPLPVLPHRGAPVGADWQEVAPHPRADPDQPHQQQRQPLVGVRQAQQHLPVVAGQARAQLELAVAGQRLAGGGARGGPRLGGDLPLRPHPHLPAAAAQPVAEEQRRHFARPHQLLRRVHQRERQHGQERGNLHDCMCLLPSLPHRARRGSRVDRCRRSEEELNSDPGSSEMLGAGTIQEHSEGRVTELPPVFVLGKGAGEPCRKNPVAWSPIRSVGSVVGMELHPETDECVFDPDASGDSGVFGEGDEDDLLSGEEGGMLWVSVAAGACCVDPLFPPNWFVEKPVSSEVEVAKPWRVKVLSELKQRTTRETAGFDAYEKAVEMSSWVKTGQARCLLKDGADGQYEDCVLELEWIGSDKGSLDYGSLAITNTDKTRTKVQFSLSEITCVVCCSEPTHPRLAVHAPKLARLASPVRLEFSGDLDKEDWMANLTLVCCQMWNAHGAPSPGATWITTSLGDVFVFDPATLEASQLRGELYAQELDVAGNVTPYLAALHNGFPPGSVLTIEASVPDDAYRFTVNLQCLHAGSPERPDQDARDVALHLNPRFEESVVVRNSLVAGQWGDEEREGDAPLRRGCEFTLTLLCEEEGFKITVDDQLFTYFRHRQKPHFVTHVNILGDVLLKKIVYQSKMVIVHPLDMFWRQMGGHLRLVETCSAGVTWGLGYDCTGWVYTGGWGGAFLRGLETSSTGIHQMRDTHTHLVYENQRWNPLTGYTAHGLPTDRYMWSDKSGRHRRTRDKTRLLSMHWQWVCDWHIDFHAPGGVDKEGWQYALDFPATYHGQKGFTDYVRRRRWVRKAQLTTSGPWQELGTTRLVDVSLQVDMEDGVDSLIDAWAVAVNGDALFRKGVSNSCPAGTVWEHVPSDLPLVSISCGPDNQVWAVGKDGSAYWRFGISASKRMGEVWEAVEPPEGKTLKQVSVGRSAVWGRDSGGQLFVRREVTPVFPEGTHWQAVASPSAPAAGGSSSAGTAGVEFQHVSAGPVLGEVWAVTSAGVVCRRYGVTVDNPAGTGWSYGIGGNWHHVSARGCSVKPSA